MSQDLKTQITWGKVCAWGEKRSSWALMYLNPMTTAPQGSQTSGFYHACVYIIRGSVWFSKLMTEQKSFMIWMLDITATAKVKKNVKYLHLAFFVCLFYCRALSLSWCWHRHALSGHSSSSSCSYLLFDTSTKQLKSSECKLKEETITWTDRDASRCQQQQQPDIGIV